MDGWMDGWMTYKCTLQAKEPRKWPCKADQIIVLCIVILHGIKDNMESLKLSLNRITAVHREAFPTAIKVSACFNRKFYCSSKKYIFLLITRSSRQDFFVDRL